MGYLIFFLRRINLQKKEYCVFFLLCSSISYPQLLNNNYIAEYNYIGNLKSGKKEHTATVYIKDSIALYSFFNNPIESRIDTIKTNHDSLTTIKYIIGNKNKSIDRIYKNLNSHKIFETVADKNYVIEDTLNTIHWEIISEIKELDSLQCQKAVSTFRGRKYIAWFSIKYPIFVGPWKLDGLPGLIIEAYTDDERYYWKLVKLHKGSDMDLNDIFRNEIIKNKTIVDPKSYYFIKKERHEKKFKDQLKYFETIYGEYQNTKMEFNSREYFE